MSRRQRVSRRRVVLAGVITATMLLGAAHPALADERTAPLPARVDAGPMRQLWQSLDNCGPAAVVMALSTFGIEVD